MTDSARSKSPQAFRTITEAAEEIGVAAHVLRFWESRFAALRPMKRAGGRRLYRVDDMALLRGLKTLLHDDGYTIKGVQKLLKDNGVAWVREAGDGSTAPGMVEDSRGNRVDQGRLERSGVVPMRAMGDTDAGPAARPAQTGVSSKPDRSGLHAVLARLQAANRRIEEALAA